MQKSKLLFRPVRQCQYNNNTLDSVEQLFELAVAFVQQMNTKFLDKLIKFLFGCKRTVNKYIGMSNTLGTVMVTDSEVAALELSFVCDIAVFGQLSWVTVDFAYQVSVNVMFVASEQAVVSWA